MSIFDTLGMPPPAAELLGWQFLDFNDEENRIRLSFDGRAEFVSPSGFIQGGFLAAMLDEVMGSTVTAATKATRFTTTISMSVDFIRPASPGPLFGEGRITSMGNSIAFLEGRLSDERGKLIARATASCKLVPLDPAWIRPAPG